jgi:hypothetical protein
MTTDPFTIVPSRRVRGSTLTRLGAALAACAVRAEQRMCLAELKVREARDAAPAPEPARPQPGKPIVE